MVPGYCLSINYNNMSDNQKNDSNNATRIYSDSGELSNLRTWPVEKVDNRGCDERRDERIDSITGADPERLLTLTLPDKPELPPLPPQPPLAPLIGRRSCDKTVASREAPLRPKAQPVAATELFRNAGSGVLAGFGRDIVAAGTGIRNVVRSFFFDNGWLKIGAFLAVAVSFYGLYLVISGPNQLLGVVNRLLGVQ